MSTRKFNTDLELQKNAGLSVPDAGYLLVAPKADDNLYLKTSAGTEKRLLTTDDSSSYVHPTGFNSVPASALTNAAVISQITVNTEGHVTGVSTRQLQPADINAQDEILVRAYSLIGNSTANDEYPIMNVGIGAGLGFDGNGSLYVTAGGGSVTSVGLAMPNIFTVTNSPVTTSGTLTAALATQTQGKVLAAPASATGTPTFRTLAASDIPALAYDNYFSWKGGVVGDTMHDIMGTQWGSGYNGVSFEAGTNMTISASNGIDGSLKILFNATGGSAINNLAAQATLSSDVTLSLSTWTTVNTISLPSAGTYYVTSKVFTNQTGNVTSFFRLGIGTTYYDYIVMPTENPTGTGTVYNTGNLVAVITVAGASTLTLAGYTANSGIKALASLTIGGATASGLTKIAYIKVA